MEKARNTYKSNNKPQTKIKERERELCKSFGSLFFSAYKQKNIMKYHLNTYRTNNNIKEREPQI